MSEDVNPAPSAASTPVSAAETGAATEQVKGVSTDHAPLTMEKAAQTLYPTDHTLEAKSAESESEAPGAATEEQKIETNPEAPKVEEPKAEKPALTLPKDSTLDASDLEQVSTFAKEKGFSPEQAQAILEQVSASKVEFDKRAEARQKQTIEQTKSEWAKSIRADKELGGANFDKTVKIAQSGLQKYARPEFIKYLEESGLGNAPDMIRTFYKIGLASQNDQVVHGAQKAPAKKSVSELMYPNMAHSK